MTNQTERILRHHLRAGAGSLDVEPPGPLAARQRARQRQRRHRTSLATVTAALVAVAGLGLFATLSSRSPGGGPVAATDTVAAAGATDLALSWRWTDGTLTFADDVAVTGDGIMYALATAPGAKQSDDARTPRAVYRTTDGESWEAVLLGDDQLWAAMAERDGLLYGIATAPTSADEVGVKVGVSSDGGETWGDEALPLDLAPPAASVEIVAHPPQVDLAVTADLTAALVVSSYLPDATPVVDERFPGAGDSWTPGPDGLIVYGVTDCPDGARGSGPDDTAAPTTVAPTSTLVAAGEAVEATVEATDESIEEAVEDRAREVNDEASGGCLDVIGEVDYAEIGLGGVDDLVKRRLLIRSDDGTWIEGQLPPLHAEQIQLNGTSSGLLLLATSFEGSETATTRLLRSSDGSSWDEVGSSPILRGLQVSADRVIGVEYEVSDGSSALAVSVDGGLTMSEQAEAPLVSGWERADIVSVAAGPLGFAALVADHSDDDARYALLTSTDGSSWTVTDLDAEGVEPTQHPYQVLVGANHVAVTFTSTTGRATGGAEPPEPELDVLLGTPQR